MAQAPGAAPQPVNVVVVHGLADLLPDSYSGDDMSVDIEEFFDRFRQWLGLHQNRFATNAERVAAIKYVLSGTALQWFNGLPATNMPATLNDLQRDLFAMFRIAKIRLEWKKDLEKCKYIPCTSTLPMSHISHWNALLYVLLLKWTFLVQKVPMIIVLIHAHVHPPMNMVHGDDLIMMGVVLLLDHPENMIEVIHLDMIIVVVRIITISHMRGMVIIEIGTPALVTMKGDTITPMLSPQV